MQTSYPRFYQNMTSDELMRACDLWTEMFAEDDVELVAVAVKQLLTTLEFPPTIADVKKEIKKLSEVIQGETTGVDEWNLISKAIKNSGYNSVEEFDKLPPIAKRFVGSPRQLRDWAISSEYNEGVVRGQFLKQRDTLKERCDYEKMFKDNPKLGAIINKIPLLSAELEKGQE